MNKIVTVILAGGQSSRCWPLKEKNLISFYPENLLVHHLKTLQAIGCRNFIVVCSEEIAKFLKKFSKSLEYGVSIDIVMQKQSKPGIGQAILFASGIIMQKFQNHPVYIINCDDIYETAVHQEIFDLQQKKSADIIVAGYKTTGYKPLGYFILDGNKVRGILEKPEIAKTPSKYANMSLHLYNNFTAIKNQLAGLSGANNTSDDHYERSLTKLCQTSVVIMHEYKDDWLILKYPWHVIDISNFFLKKVKRNISSTAIIDSSAKIYNDVVIEDNVKIMGNVKITGPTVIRKNSLIGDNSILRESYIGENSVVGFSSEISRSYVGNNCWFHRNYIGDSFIEGNVSMGSGACISNLRFDQQQILSSVKNQNIDTQRIKLGAIIGNGVQIGVNASIMPGVKIGSNSQVGPGIILYRDLSENIKLILKQNIVNMQVVSPPINSRNRESFRKKI